MSFKKYLENGMVLSHPINNLANPTNVPPEGNPLAGPSIVQSNTQNTIWEIYEHEGFPVVVLNETYLKEVLKNHQIIIESGIINYDSVNKVITFYIQDTMGSLSIEQFQHIDQLLQFHAVNKIMVEPENRRITIYIRPEFNIKNQE